MEFCYVSRMRRPECESCPHRALFPADKRYVLCKHETFTSLIDRREKVLATLKHLEGMLLRAKARRSDYWVIADLEERIKYEKESIAPELSEIEKELNSGGGCPYLKKNS